MTAAAFAKDFLKHVQRSRIEQTGTIGEVLKQIQRQQEHSQQTKLDKWLSAPNASSNYDKALKQRHDGTGIWFLQSDAFTHWKDSQNSFLWLNGIPGCGKTVLSTVVIEHLGTLRNQNDSLFVAVIYFYFDFSDETKRTVDSMACLLISQCSCQSRSAQRQLDQQFNSYVQGNKQPATEALLATLLSILEHMGQVRIVLDALDECTTRKELLQWIEGLVAPRAKTLQVIVTSRREHDIELGISSWARVEESLSLQGAAVNDDIRAFLLAACQLDVLEECLDLPDLREALATLPGTLYKTYNRILENIPKKYKRHAIRILQFLTYSERPLRVEEAVDAIAITPMADSRFDVQDWLADAREIARVCSSLVTVVYDDQIWESDQNEDQLQLAHLSVKEYLLSGQLESSFQDQLQESAARSTIAKVSLVYLLSLDHSLLVKQIKTDFPLSTYAARYWMDNALLDERKDKNLQALISKLFSSHAEAYRTRLHIYNPDRPWEEDSINQLEDLPEPLYYVSLSGLYHSMHSILDNEVNVNAQGGRYGTALNAASASGQTEAVKLLLNIENIEVDFKNGRCGTTALSQAAKRGYEAIVKLLLDIGKVEVDWKDYNDRTPLSLAAEDGHEAVTKLLLDTGEVEVDSKDNTGRTPLLWAAEWGNEAVVKLLLDTGKFEVDSKDNTGRTPFSRAAELGHEAATKLLLDTGKVEVNSRDNTGRTPLSWAVARGKEAVVKLLLDTGKVEVVSKDNTGRTPLSWAADWGQEAVVKLLLDTGKVEVASKDNTGRTPLWWAAELGHEAVVKLLLDTGKAEINSKDSEYGMTTLSWAAEGGHDAIVKLLLDTGEVNVDSKDSDDRTALSWAAEGGYEALPKLLLDTGKVEVDSKDSTSRIPFSWAAEGGHEAVLKLLLDTGKVEVDLKDSTSRTPFS
ncbi:hypothetical protein LTR17_026392 [Elasticomyces elasticus]|nr:hypothetical protein LTR17_026392 [Elasticomyces elasticus]